MTIEFELEDVNEGNTTIRREGDVIPTTPIPIVRTCAQVNTNLNDSGQDKERIRPFPTNLKFTLRKKYEVPSDNESSKMAHLKVTFKNFKYIIKSNIASTMKIVFFLLVTVFVIYACCYNFNKAKPVLVLYCLIMAYLLVVNTLYFLGDLINRLFKPTLKMVNNYSPFIIRVMLAYVIITFCLFVGVWMKRTKYNAISVTGYITILSIAVLFSKSSKNINPRTVIMALAFQMLINFVCCRLNFGVSAIKGASNFISYVIDHSKYGAKILFNEGILEMFIFKIFPPLVFFSALINLLYYIGIMGWITEKGASFMKIFLCITNIESVCTFANIFLGGVEASLLIKPYLSVVTKSEMMLIMAGGFSSIAGGMLAVFINMGIPGVHLITSCLMSPFGTVALTKIIYPDTKKHKKPPNNNDETLRTKEENFLHAISEGAAAAVGLIAYIVVNLMAFYSIGHLANSCLSYLAQLVSSYTLSLEIIFSYLFFPFSVLMGVEPQDRFKISELLGTKLFVNELIAFEKLKEYVSRSEITKRTEIIGTYALCSFSNFANLGFTIGGMTVLAPERAKQIAKLLPISFCCGFMVSIVNGTIADEESKNNGNALLCSMRFNEGNKLTYSISATHDIFQALLTLENQRRVQSYIDCSTIMSCCMAVVRFVNNMTDSAQKSSPKRAVHTTASLMNIPKWLVDMRHSIVHSHLTMDERILEDALRFCADWLYQKYWCEFVDIDASNFQHLPTSNTPTEPSDYTKLREYVVEAQEHMVKNQHDLLLSKLRSIFDKYEHRLVFYELILKDLAGEENESEIIFYNSVWLKSVIDCFPCLIEELVHFIVDNPQRLFKWATKLHVNKLKQFIQHIIETATTDNVDDNDNYNYNGDKLDALLTNLTEILQCVIVNHAKLFKNASGNSIFERTRNFIQSLVSCIVISKNSATNTSNHHPQLLLFIDDNKWNNNCAVYPIWNVPLGICIGPKNLRESFVKFQCETLPIDRSRITNIQNPTSSLVTQKPRKRPISSDIELL